jgi:NADH-quinone oxidoreductase subunit N
MNTILVLSALGLITMFAGVYNARKALVPIVVIGLIIAFFQNLTDWNTWNNQAAHSAFYEKYVNGMLRFDNYAVAFTGLLILGVIFIIFLCDQYFHDDKKNPNIADIYALILFTLVGGIMMVSYNHMAMLFIGIETLSISLYILAGSRKMDLGSNEASLKYFLMGSFSTGFLLFGIALIFGTTGSFDLGVIKDWTVTNAGNLPLIFKAGLFMILIGLFFKVSAVPFHFWAPDVYEGSPTMISALMATVVKVASFAALFRLMYICFGSILPVWFYLVWIVAVLTIVVGNFSAVMQKSVKRMLAYSSLANAGYLMIGVLALNEHASSALLYYGAAYTIATITAFGVQMIVSKEKGDDSYEAFHGLARKNPLLATVMVIAMLSLAGIPPLSGFFSKYYVFANAIENNYLYIVIIAIVCSLLGIYYYFKVIAAMFHTETHTEKLPVKTSYQAVLVLSAILILAIGLFPNWIIGLFNA